MLFEIAFAKAAGITEEHIEFWLEMSKWYNYKLTRQRIISGAVIETLNRKDPDYPF